MYRRIGVKVLVVKNIFSVGENSTLRYKSKQLKYNNKWKV